MTVTFLPVEVFTKLRSRSSFFLHHPYVCKKGYFVDRVSSVSFSPDGKTVVSRSGGKTVRLWDLETGENTKTLDWKNIAIE